MRLLPVFLALLLVAGCAGGGGSRNLDMQAPAGDQRIVIWNKVGDRADVVFRRDGKYDPEAFEKIDRVFRDKHNNDRYTIDPGLIELIAGLRDRMVMAVDTPIEILSGYRSPETNEKLSRTNKNVAKQSYHMRGMAADIRIPDMNSRALELVARTLQKGGVALYPDSGHVHVDTGPIRGWEVVKGQEAGLQRREETAREKEAEKTELVAIPNVKLPPVTVTPLNAPEPQAGKSIAKPTTKPVKASPVLSKSKPKAPAKKAAPVKKKPAAKAKPKKKTP